MGEVGEVGEEEEVAVVESTEQIEIELSNASVHQDISDGESSDESNSETDDESDDDNGDDDIFNWRRLSFNDDTWIPDQTCANLSMILNYMSFMLLHPLDEVLHIVKIRNILRRYEHDNVQF